MELKGQNRAALYLRQILFLFSGVLIGNSSMNKLLPKAELYTGRIIAESPFFFVEKSGAGT